MDGSLSKGVVIRRLIQGITDGMRLRVRVRDDLVLEAGTCEQVPGRDGPERLIHTPIKPLFIRCSNAGSRSRIRLRPPRDPQGREGVAAAAVVLRWGSYLAVLLDRDKPASMARWPASTSRHPQRSPSGSRSPALPTPPDFTIASFVAP